MPSNALEVLPPLADVQADPKDLRRLVLDAFASQEMTMAMISETIRRIVIAGEHLAKAKGELDHGQFQSWLEQHSIVGEATQQISYRTVQRWMGLARFHQKDPSVLEKAGTITQAYRLAGLLPDPDAGNGGGGGKGADVLAMMSRLEETIVEELTALPLARRSKTDLQLLQKRLSRLASIHDEISRQLEA